VSTIATTSPVTFSAGAYIKDAARDLIELVRTTGQVQCGTFNDTPIEAIPGDLPRHVMERWCLEREIYQLRNGIDLQ